MAPIAVCCLDDSDGARDALKVARRLAARLGFDLLLLHVAPSPTEPGVSAAPLGQARLAESERRDAEALLDRIAGEVGLATGEAERRVEFGNPAAGILAVCQQERAELVILGSRRHGTLKAALLGSVSAEVAGKAPCIVVVVPPGAAEHTSLA